jgi:hypothetical protein
LKVLSLSEAFIWHSISFETTFSPQLTTRSRQNGMNIVCIGLVSMVLT